ncbi:MAG: hypothetical protein L6R41_007291 [Letrouitia leprolyta]|nr:MAG: hypothetical protein L6R41_007291 [Letrouitia leprolyta]
MKTSLTRTKKNKQYQDIPALPAADPGLNPPPTPYRSLAYGGFSINAPGVPILQTIDKSIYYSVQTRLLGSPAISNEYTNSSVQAFDLTSFTFVCVVQTAESLKGVGTNCTVRVNGTKAAGGGGAQVMKECKYVQQGTGLDIAPATCVLGGGFALLEKADFMTVDPPVIGTALLVTAIDNVAVVVRQVC